MLPLLYSPILLIACFIAWPAWVIKMRRRGGWGTGLLQRVGLYQGINLHDYRGCDYFHAVSVGEAVMAQKLIAEIRKHHPDYRAIIACTTATGHQLASSRPDLGALVIYAPLDFQLLLRRLFRRITPRQVILIDSELWPNLLLHTQRYNIPLKIANGRISESSFNNFSRLPKTFQKLLHHVSAVCVDGDDQLRRWAALGVPKNVIHNVGSLKFDFTPGTSSTPTEFTDQLAMFPPHQCKILLASTHAPEEEKLSQELLSLTQPILLMVAPRHAERRAEVKKALQNNGFHVTLRSNFSPPDPQHSRHAFLLDTTGELSRWTALADIVIIGKSWLNKRGGQNPFEAISQGIPLIAGPHMDNFNPLFSEVISQEGALQVNTIADLSRTIEEYLHHNKLQGIATTGKNILSKKLGATQKTTEILVSHFVS